MFIYILIYLPFVLCAFFDFFPFGNKFKRNVLNFWVIIFTLFRGLRWKTGTDWDQFYQVFRSSSWSNIFTYERYVTAEGVSHMDAGYMFLNTFVHEIGFGYSAFLLLTNFMIMLCFKDFSLKVSKFPILTMILLMNVGMPFPVRQSISFAVLLWGYQFLDKKNIKKYLLVLICAISIHKGALIGLPLLALPYIDKLKNINWKIWAILYLATFFVSKVFSGFISDAVMSLSAFSSELNTVASTYSRWEDTTIGLEGGFNNSLFSGLSFSIIFALLLYLREKKGDICQMSIKNFNLYFLLYGIAACFNNLVSNSTSPIMAEIVGRSIASIDMYPIVFPLIFVCFAKMSGNSVIKTCLVFLFVVFMLYKFWNQIPGSFYSFLFIPYKSVI